ncbi:MAG: nucleotidyltransferase family protein [Gammaproteobacteria bacterium]
MINPDLKIPANELRALCARHAIRELAIFGSAVTENFMAESDVDVLVEFQPHARVGFLTLSRLQRELSALFDRPVDLVPKSGLKAQIREGVLATAKVVYAA